MNKIRRGPFVLIPEREPSLFDWRDQLDDADYIISEVKKPVPMPIGSRREEPSPGIDLSNHRESLAKFLAELAESHIMACQDFAMRNDPNKPKPKLEDNWKDTGCETSYDYGADAGVGIYLDWKEFWDENYKRDAGNPGKNRTPTQMSVPRPPIEPLRQNIPAIMGWWKAVTKGGFSPKFARRKTKDDDGEPFDRNNPPARFFIHVIQYLEGRFEQANIRGVYDTVKKKQRKATKDENE